MSRVRPADGMDSVKSSKSGGMRRAVDVLYQAQTYWSALDRFRRDRERAKRYTYGDQWGDVIEVDGRAMTEEEYIRRRGNVPLKNNLIRRLVRSVVGVTRNQDKEPVCVAREREEQQLGEVMSALLQYNGQVNKMKELQARAMEEFLISGMVVFRKWYGWRNDRCDCWTEYVQPNSFFIDNKMRDFRGWDCTCLGEVHDVDFATLCARFAKSPSDYAKLKDIYATAGSRSMLSAKLDDFGYSRRKNWDFLFSSEPGMCRVVEVWRKETKPRYHCHDWNSGECFKIDASDYAAMVRDENAERMAMAEAEGIPREEVPLVEAQWFLDDYWYYYFIAPTGEILDEGETPYGHKSHPYVFKVYPFIDGEVHSFVSDIIDQQRYSNRLITMFDWVVRTNAKGVLMIPEDSIPPGMSPESFAEEWCRVGGVVVYRPSKSGEQPHQVTGNSTGVGISELLNLQLKFFEEISGVNGPLQGKAGYSGMSASLYAQQTANATTSLADILEAFSSFIEEGALKDVKNIQQFYDGKTIERIAGVAMEFDGGRVREAEFDLSVTQSQSTPAYRLLANEFLLEMLRAGQVGIEDVLEHGAFPFGDKLLQSIQARKERMADAQVAEDMAAAGQGEGNFGQNIS